MQQHFGDDSAHEKNEHRVDAIKAFSMGQIAAAPSIFRHCLKSAHISQCLTSLIPIAFGNDAKENLRTQAQYKLFSTVKLLQKLKFGEASSQRKGFVEDSNKLWLSVANAKINNLIKGSEETLTVARQHKRFLKFVKKQVTPLRVQLFARLSDETVMEKRVALETEAKKALAIEKLILSLSLTMCVPGVDVRDLTDTHEQVEDLMECFSQL